MSRIGVTTLALLALLLVSGRPPAAPVAGGDPGAQTVASAEFGEAEIVQFLERANPVLASRDVDRIAAAIVRYSAEYGLDPLLVTQVMWVESGARPWVRSPRGAIGLMQVMPHMATEIGFSGSLTSIENNVEAGCWILSDNIRRLGEEDGISAYFWGSNIRSVAYLDRVRRARAAVRGPSES